MSILFPSRYFFESYGQQQMHLVEAADTDAFKDHNIGSALLISARHGQIFSLWKAWCWGGMNQSSSAFCLPAGPSSDTVL